jgi:hypothetical protein
MTELERKVKNLSQSDFEKFREWFMEYDWENWDESIEKDLNAGKLDQLISEAKEEFKAGKAREL